MPKMDFDYAKHFLPELAERYRPIIIKFYSEHDELSAAAALEYYSQRVTEDKSLARHEFEVLELLAKKMGTLLDVPPALAEKRAEQSIKTKARLQEQQNNARTAKNFKDTFQVIGYSVVTVIVLGVAVMIWTIWHSIFDYSGPSVSQRLQSQGIVLVGHTATVREDFPCAGTSTAEQQVVNAVSANDSQGATNAIADSGGFDLHSGWRVRAIDSAGAFDSLTRFRVESGPRVGDSCWLPTDINIFSNLALSATSAAPSAAISAKTPLVLPAFGQTYGTTDRELKAYKWSNNDNTQMPNVYDIPARNGTIEISLMYSRLKNGQKRVADVHFHNFPVGLGWRKVKWRYIPKDATALTVADIGGNIRDVFTPPDPNTSLAFYHSHSLAERERKWGVPACSDDSETHGLLIVEGILSHGAMTDVMVTDAALHYCGTIL